MCAPEGFHYFINHVKQRLVVILDYNIRNGLDPCQTDILLLRELYNIYDDGSIDTFSETEPTIHVEQIGLFGHTVMDSGKTVTNTPTAQSLTNKGEKQNNEEV